MHVHSLAAMVRPFVGRFASMVVLALAAQSWIATTASALLLPDPVHRWSFTGDTADTGTVGGATGTLNNGAAVVGNRLSLDGSNDFMLTSGMTDAISAKTLVSWVSLSTLAQASGSALTLQTAGGATFDGIVYAERTANQWMNGSNGFSRSNGANNGGIAESVIEPGEVMMAITYADASTLTIYRNGALYATYNPGSLINYTGTAEALFGFRHTGGGGAPLGGFINEARIYNEALDALQIAELFALGPDLLQTPSLVPEPSTIALLTFGAALVVSRAKRRIER